jgi:hypothetical protein
MLWLLPYYYTKNKVARRNLVSIVGSKDTPAHKSGLSQESTTRKQSTMALPKKGVSCSRSNAVKACHHKSLKKYWNNSLAELSDPAHPSGANGRIRSVHENFLILMSLKMLLQTYLEYNLIEIRKLNWTMIESKVATMLKVQREHVTSVRKEFLDEGEILDKCNNNKNGLIISRGSYHKKCLTRDQLEDIENEVELWHSEGKAVTNLLMRNFLQKKHNISVSKSTILF